MIERSVALPGSWVVYNYIAIVIIISVVLILIIKFFAKRDEDLTYSQESSYRVFIRFLFRNFLKIIKMIFKETYLWMIVLGLVLSWVILYTFHSIQFIDGLTESRNGVEPIVAFWSFWDKVYINSPFQLITTIFQFLLIISLINSISRLIYKWKVNTYFFYQINNQYLYLLTTILFLFGIIVGLNGSNYFFALILTSIGMFYILPLALTSYFAFISRSIYTEKPIIKDILLVVSLLSATLLLFLFPFILLQLLGKLVYGIYIVIGIIVIFNIFYLTFIYKNIQFKNMDTLNLKYYYLNNLNKINNLNLYCGMNYGYSSNKQIFVFDFKNVTFGNNNETVRNIDVLNKNHVGNYKEDSYKFGIVYDKRILKKPEHIALRIKTNRRCYKIYIDVTATVFEKELVINSIYSRWVKLASSKDNTKFQTKYNILNAILNNTCNHLINMFNKLVDIYSSLLNINNIFYGKLKMKNEDFIYSHRNNPENKDIIKHFENETSEKQHFIFIDGKFGTGKTLTTVLNAPLSDKKPIIISPWNDGYQHDVLQLIYKRVKQNDQNILAKYFRYLKFWDKKSGGKDFIIFYVIIIAALAAFCAVFEGVYPIIRTYLLITPFFSENLLGFIELFGFSFWIKLVGILIVGFCITTLYIDDIIIYKKNSTRDYHDFFVNYISNTLSKKNEVLVLEDIDRLESFSIKEVFTVINSINRSMPYGFKGCIGAITLSENSLKGELKNEFQYLYQKTCFDEVNIEGIDQNIYDDYVKQIILFVVDIMKELANDSDENKELLDKASTLGDNNYDFLNELNKVLFEKELTINSITLDSYRQIDKYKIKIIEMIREKRKMLEGK